MPAKLTIEEMRVIAESRGGKCLSAEYNGSNSKLEWQCADGHIWKACPNEIKNNHTWCPYCWETKIKLTIEEMQAIAESRGGKCLSKEYKDSDFKLIWECSKGHNWLARPHDVKNKSSWCPYCNGNLKYTLEDVCEIAKKRGGKCLSTEYNDNKEKLEWECSLGHIWKARLNDVVSSDSWCPHCAGHTPINIEKMQEIAEKRGGKCLSVECHGAFGKLEWQCSHGHKWKANPNSVMDSPKRLGTWCPKCRCSVSEEVCRKYFEAIFGCSFDKARPDWLIGVNGYKLELDGLSNICFNGKYIAFEHDGGQHHRLLPFISIKQFETLQKNDHKKNELCLANDVILFRIPELFRVTGLGDLGECIRKIANANGIDINTNIFVELSGIYESKNKYYMGSMNKEQLELYYES